MVFHAVSSEMVHAVAPQLWAYEIRNSLLMAVRRGRISKTDGEEFIRSLSAFDVQLSAPASYDVLFSLAHRYGLTVYDAAYLSVALEKGLPLATLGKQLVKAAR